MANKEVSPPLLKQAVSELISTCKKHLFEGSVDVAEVGRGVQAYCEAVAGLPAGEGKQYKQDLEDMMREVEDLGETLVAARDLVRSKLEALEKLKSASVAYQKSDAVAGNFIPKKSES